MELPAPKNPPGFGRAESLFLLLLQARPLLFQAQLDGRASDADLPGFAPESDHACGTARKDLRQNDLPKYNGWLLYVCRDWPSPGRSIWSPGPRFVMETD